MSLCLYGLEVARVAGLVTVLAVASYQDLVCSDKVVSRSGKEFVSGVVSNRLWLYVFVGLALLLVENLLFFNWVLFVMELASMGGSVFFGLLLVGVGGWGGADAKAFMLIGFCVPLFPVWGVFYPFPLPLAVLFVSCGLAVVFSLFRQRGKMGERHLRFLPFMLVGLLVSLL